MCKLCEEYPVYEFTNQRKLCKRCFINYFNKKFLYTLRKFELISPGDVVGYYNKKDVNSVVLISLLKSFKEKIRFDLFCLDKKPSIKYKIADISCIDNTTQEIFETILHWDIKKLDLSLPYSKNKKIIKPLYFFLKQEIILFANLKELTYFNSSEEKTSSFEKFIDEFEKNHPEVKRATVNSLLKLYSL